MLATVSAQLTFGLLLWATLALGSAVLGLYARPREWWRGFWFMSGLWGFIDAAIALFAFATGPLPAPELAPILRLNSGLDVGYCLIGAVLLTRPKPVLRGFGVAIILHGLFLLLIDLVFWQRAGDAVGAAL